MPAPSDLEAVSRTKCVHRVMPRLCKVFICFLIPASCILDAYTSSEIMFTWRKGPVASVECPKESMSLLQYDLVGQTLSSEIFKSNTGNVTHCQLSHPFFHNDNKTVLSESNTLFCEVIEWEEHILLGTWNLVLSWIYNDFLMTSIQHGPLASELLTCLGPLE